MQTRVTRNPGYPLFCQTRNPGLRKPDFTQTRLNPGLLETKPGFLKTFSTTISVVNLIKQIIFNHSRGKFSKSKLSNPSQASLPTTRAAAFSKRCNLSVMVLGDLANTVLQPSIGLRDVMKAYTRAFADSASSRSDRRILRI